MKFAKYSRGEGRLIGGGAARTVDGGDGAREPSYVASRREPRSVWRAVRVEAPEETGGSVMVAAAAEVAETDTGEIGAAVGAGPRRAK